MTYPMPSPGKDSDWAHFHQVISCQNHLALCFSFYIKLICYVVETQAHSLPTLLGQLFKYFLPLSFLLQSLSSMCYDYVFSIFPSDENADDSASAPRETSRIL